MNQRESFALTKMIRRSSDKALVRKTTELDQIAQELRQELNRTDMALKISTIVSEANQGRTSKKKKKKKKTKKKEPIKFELVKFKFVEPVDDNYVMEYGLPPDEIMDYRKNQFHIERDPKILIRETKSSELKEEFGTYCGVKKTIKNWLYWV